MKELGRFGSVKEAKEAGFDPRDYTGAGLHQVLGPHFRPILWVKDRPYVQKQSHSKQRS